MSYTDKDHVRSISLSFEADGTIQLNASIVGALFLGDKLIATKVGSTSVSRSLPSSGDAVDALVALVNGYRAEDVERLRVHLEEEAVRAKAEAAAAKERLVKEAADAQARADEAAAKAKG